MKYSLRHFCVNTLANAIIVLALVLIVSLTTSVYSQEANDDSAAAMKVDQALKVDHVLADAIKTLGRHHVALTADEMRKCLQLLDPKHPSHQKLESQASALIEDLNSTDYLVRENATRSLKMMTTVSKLQLAAAVDSKDPEVAYRARAILDYANSRNRRDTEKGIIESVCVVIQAKQIKGMADILLATLDLVEDSITQRAIGNALAATAENTDLRQLRSALQSKNAARRIASSGALLKLLGPEAAEDLQQRLKIETDDHVRVAFARSLANFGIRASLPILVELMESDELTVRVESSQVLRALTGQRFGFVAYESTEKRQASMDRWQSWLAEEGETVKLQFPIRENQLPVGRILYADYRQNKAVEVDMNGKEVWSVDLKSAWNVQGLSNGHRLVTSYAQRKVIEFDREGKEIWKLDQLPRELMGLHRLENGNTLVGCGSKVIEYQRDGTSIWQAELGGRVSQCQRLSNGNTLVALFDRNKVVEINPKGETVWSIDTAQNPMAAHRTNAGTTLIAALSDPVIREYDQGKQVIWQFTVNGGGSAVRRLPNGDTLINSKTEIQLVSPDKKVRWRIKGLQHSFGLWAY